MNTQQTRQQNAKLTQIMTIDGAAYVDSSCVVTISHAYEHVSVGGQQPRPMVRTVSFASGVTFQVLDSPDNMTTLLG